MKIDYEIVAELLNDIFTPDALIYQSGGDEHSFDWIVQQLTNGVNRVLELKDRLRELREEQDKVDYQALVATGEIEAQIVEVQAKCPHYSSSETEHANPLVTCNICGMILEEEMYGDIQ